MGGAEALVNLDVELIVRRRINAGAEPIAVLETAQIRGLVCGQGKELNQFCRDRVDEITRAGGKLKGSAHKIWISRAGVSGKIIERNEVLTKGAGTDVWICGFGS